MAQGKLLPLVAVNFHLDPARQVLPKIKEVVTVGGGKFPDNGQPLQAANRLILLPDEGVKAVVKQSGGLRCRAGEGEILRFTVVNFRKLHSARCAEPAFIGADPFLAPVGVDDAKRCQRGGGVAVVVGRRHKAELALVPAVCQRKRHAVFAAVQRYGVGLVLQALAVVRPAGVEIAVVHHLAVDLRLVHTQGCGVKACFCHVAAYGKLFIQHWADWEILIKSVSNPLGFALKRTAVQQTRLKAACGFGGFAVVVPYRDRPVILGAGRQVRSEVFQQDALRICHAPRIPDAFAAAGQLQAVGGLQCVLAVAFQFPAKAGLYLVQTQRLVLVFYRQVVKFQHTIASYANCPAVQGGRAQGCYRAAFSFSLRSAMAFIISPYLASRSNLEIRINRPMNIASGIYRLKV